MVSINGTNISVTRGDTLDISIEILYPDGSPYTVLAGDGRNHPGYGSLYASVPLPWKRRRAFSRCNCRCHDRGALCHLFWIEKDSEKRDLAHRADRHFRHRGNPGLLKTKETFPVSFFFFLKKRQQSSAAVIVSQEISVVHQLRTADSHINPAGPDNTGRTTGNRVGG